MLSDDSFQTTLILLENTVEENFQIQHFEMAYLAKTIMQISTVHNFYWGWCWLFPWVEGGK